MDLNRCLAWQASFSDAAHLFADSIMTVHEKATRSSAQERDPLHIFIAIPSSIGGLSEVLRRAVDVHGLGWCRPLLQEQPQAN